MKSSRCRPSTSRFEGTTRSPARWSCIFRARGFWCCRHKQGGTCRNLLICLPLCRHGQSNRQIVSKEIRREEIRNGEQEAGPRRRHAGFRRKIGIRRGHRRRRRPRRTAAAGSRRTRSGIVAGRGRAGPQGLSADAVLDQRARLLGQKRRPAGVAVYDRAAAPDRRQCRLSIRHQCLESRDLRRHREARFRHRVLSHRGVFSARDRQRAARRGAGVRPHGHPAPLARLADQFGDVALAGERPLLPAQPRRRRSQESGIPHRRGFADRDRLAGGFRRRRHLGVPVGRDLHRRALDHRRRADGDARRIDRHHPRLSRHRRRRSTPRSPRARS